MDFQVIGARAGESGTRVKIQRDGIEAAPADLGTTGHVGAYRWGPIRQPIVHTDRAEFTRWRGGELEEDPTPSAALDFYDEGGANAKLVTLRLTDGNEAKARLQVFGRDVSPSQLYTQVVTPPTQLFTLEGAYAGRRGGRTAYLGGKGGAFVLAAGTFATGVAVPKDAWAGAEIRFTDPSPSNTARGPWTVTGNDAAGLLSLDLPVGATAPSATATWNLYLAPTHLRSPDGFAVAFSPGARKPASEFAADVYVDGNVALPIGNASVQADVDTYLKAQLQQGLRSRQQMYLTATMAGSLLAGEETRAANWCGRVAMPDLSGEPTDITNAVEVDTVYWSRTGAHTGYCQSESTVYPAVPIRCKAVVTFTDGAGAFTVEYQLWDGTVISTGLDAGTAGTLYNPRSRILPSFLVRQGNATAAHGLVIYFNPLPLNLRDLGGYFYPTAILQDDKGTDLRKRYRILSNTATTITLAAGVDLGTDDLVTNSMPAMDEAPDAGDYTLATGTETFIYTINGGADQTLTLTESAGDVTADELKAALNALEAALHPGEQRIEFFTTGEDKLAWYTPRDSGSDAELVVKSTSTLLPILGFAAEAQTVNGTDGSVVAVSYAQDLHGGRDGIATLGEASEYELAFDVEDSPLNDIDGQNLGLVDFACPGVTTADVQNAAAAYCYAKGYTYSGEIAPADAATEEAAAAWARDNIDPKGVWAATWDSWCVPKRGLVPGSPVARTAVGAVQGMRVRIAREWNGYHKAAAGTAATIDRNFTLVASASDDAPALPKKERVLNEVGLQALQQSGARIFVNGARMPADQFLGSLWHHKVRVQYHLARELLVAGNAYTFDPIDGRLFNELARTIRSLFFPRWTAGWFTTPPGGSFEDVIEIRADADLNPAESTQLGKAIAAVRIKTGIVDTAETVEFVLGAGGVSVRQG